ncbi:hypothetical protein LCGC14_2339890 [marine sediment metagenome]|uniref:Ribbon-helix-helix protein CopG domain-containing protein n=1 Tax=marine sediment metagenome TaxID=412755 RepID=A0A0F9EQ32_9ZZZZ
MRVSFTIDDNILAQFDVIAREQGRPRSNLIKKLIKEYLMKYNYVAEQTKEHNDMMKRVERSKKHET